jgi:hypothetical protein
MLFSILNSCCVCGLEDGKMGEPGKLLGTLYFPWLRLLFYSPIVLTSIVQSIINI